NRGLCHGRESLQ
ncbi:DNA-directed RNA polymerase, beta subunit, partial [Chlamydia psittaci 09DC78]